jgi:hypothetical protein
MGFIYHSRVLRPKTGFILLVKQQADVFKSEDEQGLLSTAPHSHLVCFPIFGFG